MPSAPDSTLLARAQAERRTVVTFDKDFGDLAYKTLAPAHCGVVLVRERRRGVRPTLARILEILEMRDDWTGWFVSADAERVRMRPLPRRR
jgi:predicted nuclease of predicted toxin-antitoxin system